MTDAPARPVVSVIVATHRRDRELRRALHSLTQQTYPAIEIVVVDDNADAQWNAVVQRVIEESEQSARNVIVSLTNEVRRGSAGTRNVGIHAAKGEYVTFLDDDDVYLPEKVLRQVSHMVSECADYCITDLMLFNESGNLVEHRRRHYLGDAVPSRLLRCHLMHHMTGTDTLMFRRDYLLELGGFPPVDVGDEFYLVQNAIEAGGRFAYLPVCDVRAYIHSTTDGLSSGQTKIDGENALYEVKQSYFSALDRKSVAYVNMRHWAVLAFAELRRGRPLACFLYAARSVLSSPVQCAGLLLRARSL